ncbi:MAG: DUF6282 family protein [Clostridia bacterium]
MNKLPSTFDPNEWAFSRSYQRSIDLLQGAVDLHVHAGPHLVSSPRSIDPVRVAIKARDMGMRAIAYMCVFNWSVGTAWIVNETVPDFTTYGGIILNTVFGGMNPRAVKTAVYYGSCARYVSFGAHSTKYQAGVEGRYVDGEWKRLVDISPEFREEYSHCIEIPLDKPTKELNDILRIVADNPHIYLVSGHISNEEALRLCDYANDYGIKKVLISNAVTEHLSKQEKELAVKKGAKLEKCLAEHTHTGSIPKTHYYVEPEFRAYDEGQSGSPQGGVFASAAEMKEFGIENFIVSTDFGVYTLPDPVEGMREWIACLQDCGWTDAEIRMVTSENPANMLGLEKEEPCANKED